MPQPTTVQSTPIVQEQSPPFVYPTVTTAHSSTYEQYMEELNRYQQQFQQYDQLCQSIKLHSCNLDFLLIHMEFHPLIIIIIKRICNIVIRIIRCSKYSHE